MPTPSSEGLAFLERCSCTSWGRESVEGTMRRCHLCHGFAFVCGICRAALDEHDPRCPTYAALPVELQRPQEPFLPASTYMIHSPRWEKSEVNPGTFADAVLSIDPREHPIDRAEFLVRERIRLGRHAKRLR